MSSEIEAALLDASIRRDGFLSLHLSRAIALSRSEHKEWFDLAEGLNRLSMRLLWSLKPRNRINREVLVAILFGRCLSAYQGAFILAERGMILEGRYVVRAMLEATFALTAIVRRKNFSQRYIDDDNHRTLQLIDACFRMPRTHKKFNNIDSMDLRRRKREIKKIIKSTNSKALKIWEAAKAAGMSYHYNTAYRLLSNTAHSSARDLDYHILPKSETEIQKLLWGPQVAKSADVLMHACDFLFISAHCVRRVFKRPELENQFAALHRRFQKLLEPLV